VLLSDVGTHGLEIFVSAGSSCSDLGLLVFLLLLRDAF
jgi:hypothetical protein